MASSTPSPTAPLPVRLLLLALLPLIAVLLYLEGQEYDPGLVELRRPETAAGAALLPDELAGLGRMGELRGYTKENLYEYINGHAEFFIGAGFRGLTVAEYGPPGGDAPQLVINLYDMGSALSAFGVLVEESGGQEAVEVGGMGFAGSQGVSFILGPYYVQVSLFDSALEPRAAAMEVADRLAAGGTADGVAFRFPELGTVAGTRYVHEFYRGLEMLNRVVERTFTRDGGELRAFILSGTPEAIAGTVAELEAFYAGEEIPLERVEREGLGFQRVRDPYEGEWFFVPLEGELLGVFAPLDDGLAEAILRFSSSREG